MKLTFPHMGSMHVCTRAVFEYLGMEVILPPPTTKRTVTLGVQHGPEFACLPLKINLGNLIEAAELGADTVVFAGGCGPCRFGYYAQVEQEILKDLGYNLNMVVIEPPDRHMGQFITQVREITGHSSITEIIKAIRFAFAKARAVDDLERLSYQVRPRELDKGSTTKVYKQYYQLLDDARTVQEIEELRQVALGTLNQIPVRQGFQPLRIALTGEIFTLLDNYTNCDVALKLGEMGVEVEKTLYLSEWINQHLFMGLVRNMRNSKNAEKAAHPYLCHFVGGHGQDTVGHTVLYAKYGFDGAIQTLPFTCMPEIVAMSVLPEVSKEHKFPVLTLIIDEHSGEAGMITRLEAFVDLLERKRQYKEA